MFISEVNESEIKKERGIARGLRNSRWWKRKTAKGTCYYCRAVLHPRDITMDHIVPLVRGGKSIKGNIVTACKECNNKKKYMLPIEWDDYINELAVER